MRSFLEKIRNVTYRECRRLLSRPIYLLTSVGAMLFCYLFFLTFMGEGLPQRLPIGIVDGDQSALSRTIVQSVNASPQVEVVGSYASFSEAREAMQRGEIYAFIDVSPGFQADLLANRRPGLAFYVNNAYLVAGSLSYKDLTYVSELMSAAIKQQSLQARGVVGEESLMPLLQPIAIDTHPIGNPEVSYNVYLSNVLLPGVLQLLIILFTVFGIGVEIKENSTREWVSTGGGSMLASLTGKLLVHNFLFYILGLVGFILLYGVMRFPMNGSIAWMSVALFVFVLAHQAIGIFIIGLFLRLRDAISLSVFYGLLGFTFAGFTFPIEAMPRGVRIFANFFPIRHYFKIYANEALHGAGIRYSLIYFVAMMLFLILPFLVYSRLAKTVNNHSLTEGSAPNERALTNEGVASNEGW